jgi:hypothetical protein
LHGAKVIVVFIHPVRDRSNIGLLHRCRRATEGQQHGKYKVQYEA